MLIDLLIDEATISCKNYQDRGNIHGFKEDFCITMALPLPWLLIYPKSEYAMTYSYPTLISVCDFAKIRPQMAEKLIFKDTYQRLNINIMV